MGSRTRSKLRKEMEEAELPSSNMDNYEKQAIRNPVILEIIFKQCPIKTLKHCRLVSKQWYDLSLEQWRSRALLKIQSDHGKLALRYQQFFGNPLKNWEQPNADMMKLKTRPYRKLRVTGELSGDEIQGKYLLTLFAPHLHELYLDSWDDVEYWEKLMFELAPNLKKLFVGNTWSSRMTGQYDPEFRVARQQQNFKKLELQSDKWFYLFPMTWQAFLSTFTKLEVLVFSVRNKPFGNTDFATRFEEFLIAVKEVKLQNPDNLQIHHLDFISRPDYWGDKFIPESLVTRLHDVTFPLTTLKIDICKTTMEVVVQQLLHLYKDTLEILVIVRRDDQSRPENRNPSSSFLHLFTEPMKCLKRLEVYGPIVKDMSYLVHTPNLEKLSICEVAYSEYSFRATDVKDLRRFSNATQMVDEVVEEVKLSKLQEFNTYFTLENAATVKILGSWMPNLEKLQVRVTSGDGFREMCNQWGNTLQKMVLTSGSYLVDEDITGISGKECDSRARNLTLMKNLQIFIMQEYICPKEVMWRQEFKTCNLKFSKITDHSVLNGFLKLPQLHTLQLQSTENMDLKSRKLLQKKGIHVSERIRTVCKCAQLAEWKGPTKRPHSGPPRQRN